MRSAKSVFPRVVPVTKDLVLAATTPIGTARDALAAAAESDYLLVNLWRAAARAGAVSRTRSSSSSCAFPAKVGFRPARTCCATASPPRWRFSPRTPRIVKELLGHASVASTDVYLHSRWTDMRAAVGEPRRASRWQSR